MEPSMYPDSAILPETGVTAELYRAAIGPRNQDYYLKHFSRFDTQGKTSATWHWPAYWTTLNWLIYRRMWGWALAYGAAVLGLALVVFGVGKLVFEYSNTTGVALFFALMTAAFVLPGMYANAWYYNFCNQKISSVLRRCETISAAVAVLSKQASDSKRYFATLGANVALVALLAGVAVAVFLPEADAPLALATEQPASKSLEDAAGKRNADARNAEINTLLAQHVAAPAAMPVPVVPAPQPVLPPTPPTPPESPTGAPPPEVATAPNIAPTPTPTPTPATPAVAAARAHPEPAVAPAANKAALKKSKSAKSPAADSAPVAKPKRNWLVQVGAFAQEANAQSVRAKVEATGFQTLPEPSDAPAGKLIRVRVGPFENKADAEKAAQRLQAMELPTVLVRQ